MSDDQVQLRCQVSMYDPFDDTYRVTTQVCTLTVNAAAVAEEEEDDNGD